MYKSEVKIRVRYSETDQMGYVYYGNYAQYYEIARTELLREMGLPYSKLEENGIMMPVLNLHVNFLKPSKYDELLTIRVFLKEKPSIRIAIDYEIFNENNELINTGRTELAFIDTISRKPRRLPALMQEITDKYFK